MKTFEVTIEPMTFTNDIKTRKMTINAKRPNPDQIMKNFMAETNKSYIDYKITIKDKQKEKTYFYYGSKRRK